MLDKQVVKFTRDGMQKQNLATGESEMLTESEHAKQIRYNPLQTVYNGRRFSQPIKAQNHTIQHYKVAAANAKLAGQKKESAVDAANRQKDSIQQSVKGQHKTETTGYYKKASGANLSEKELKQIHSKALARQKRQERLSAGKTELKNAVVADLSENDDTGLQAVGKTYQIAEDTEKAAKHIREWLGKIRTNREFAKQLSSAARNTQRYAASQVSTQAASTQAVRAAALRQQAMKTAQAYKAAYSQKAAAAATKNIAQTAAKAASGKVVAIVAAILFGILLVMQIMGSFSAITGGNSDTDLATYVKQLDDEFLQKVSAEKAEYEKQPNTDVKIVGMDSVHTNPTELALLATAEWSMIDLTDENKQLLKARYDVLHTYEVTETDDSSSSELDSDLSLPDDVSSQITPSRHIVITIHVYTPEEKIDAFGFTAEQKQQVLEALPALREINAAMGATGSIIIEGNGEYAWPVPGFTYISSQFGEVVDRSKPHPGVDIAGANIYGKPIVAAADGKVTEITSGWGGGYGNSVLIDHGNGYTSRYGHCSSVAVHNGDVVKKGQVIAYVGSTGDSTGPHCHFEIRKDGTPVNPMPFITGTKGGT